MAKNQPPQEAEFFSHISDPTKRAAMNAAAPANPVDAAIPEKAPASPQPDLLYSTNDLQAILDKYEEERRKAIEEEIKKASQNLPAMLPQQSVADYINVNRNLIKTNSPQIFEKIGSVNKSEHEEMQQKGGYKPISFNKGAPSSLDIMGKYNKPIYTLNYRSDGDLVIAEVPPSINKGPMHLSLALQDANGENIEADKAAYFNISYGADGKIKSMHYPEPLEFEGDRCKFLIDKQPYYLKVNKATLDALNTELAKNRGQGVKRAQDVGFEPALDDHEQQPQHQPIIAAPTTPFVRMNTPSPAAPAIPPTPPASPTAPHHPTPPKPTSAAPQLKPMVLGGQGGGGKKDDVAVDLHAARENLKKTNLLDEKGEWHKSPTEPTPAQSAPPPLKPMVLGSQGGDGKKDDMAVDLNAARAKLKKTNLLNKDGEWHKRPTEPTPAQSAHLQASAAPKPAPAAMKLGSEGGGGKPTLQDLNKEAMAKAPEMAAHRQTNYATATQNPRQTPKTLEPSEEREETTFTLAQPKQTANPQEKIAVVEEQLPMPAPQPQPNMLNGARRVVVEESAKPVQQATRIEAPQPKTAPETNDPAMPALHDAAKAVTQGLEQMLGNLERDSNTSVPPPPAHTLEEENLVRALHKTDNDGKPLEGAELDKAIQGHRVLQAEFKERMENQAAGRPSGSFDLDELEEVNNTPPTSNTERASFLESIRAGKKLREVPKDTSDPLRQTGEETALKHATEEQRKILARRDGINTDKAPDKPVTPRTEPLRQFTPPKKQHVTDALKGTQPSSPPVHNSTTPTSTPPSPGGAYKPKQSQLG